MTVVEVDASAVLELRGRVLRDGRRHEGFSEDHDPSTIHLAVIEDGEAVGVVTFVAREDGAWQLRGMAVESSRQGSGIGRAIVLEGLSRLRDASLVWANARDTALGFYESVGFTVVGDGYELSGLPHHRIELVPTG